MNVLFVSHCDVTGHSANHVFQVAMALRDHGVDPAIAIPRDPHSVHGRGNTDLQVVYYDEAASEGVLFSDGQGPDLIHAWTPREHVRKLTETLVARYGCRYVVHLEDNENAITADELQPFPFAEFKQLPLALLDELVPWNRHHPRRAQMFLEGASGVTSLIDRLLEFKPEGIPGAVFWPGFDEAFLHAAPVSADCHSIVYTGNIHASNRDEVVSLILAVGILNRRGHNIKLIKTGSNLAAKDIVLAAREAGFLIDLGIIPRTELPALLHQADILIQPGKSGPFNDHRFPSKLPEFLAAGKPVLLPAANIGLVLRDGVECVRLATGSASEIVEKIEDLLANPARAKEIGRQGRAFAIANLRWSNVVAPILNLYRTLPHAAPAARTVSELPLLRLMFENDPLPERLNYLALAVTSINHSQSVPVNSSDIYTKWLAAVVERTLALRTIQEPVIHIQMDPGRSDPEWLGRTWRGLTQGIAGYFRNRGLRVLDSQIERYAESLLPEAPART